jgi:hypothetical protein
MQTITFKLADNEAHRLRVQAKKAGLTVSEFVRRRLQSEENQTREGPAFQICPRTGARIFAPAPHYPPLTTESVKEMMSDFP